MTVVLDENEWVREKISSRSLGKKPFELLYRAARFFLDEGYAAKDVRRMLDTLVLQCDPSASLPKWSDTLDRALERASKYEAVKIDHIGISKKEMERIDALPGKQTRRLAFTLLCLAKYWDAVNPRGDHWVNNKDGEIMSMANVSTSLKRQGLMYHTLWENHMIQFSKRVDVTHVRVCFIDEDGEEAMRITDFRNLGYQYLKAHGEPFFECANCGVTVRYDHPVKGLTQKYCHACAAEIATRQRVNSVMRIRDSAVPQSGFVEKAKGSQPL